MAEIRKPLPTEHVPEDTDGLLRPPEREGVGEATQQWPLGAVACSSCAALSVSADVRSSDDVIAFEGHVGHGNLTRVLRVQCRGS